MEGRGQGGSHWRLKFCDMKVLLYSRPSVISISLSCGSSKTFSLKLSC